MRYLLFILLLPSLLFAQNKGNIRNVPFLSETATELLIDSVLVPKMEAALPIPFFITAYAQDGTHSEIMKVTADLGDSAQYGRLTILRGAEGTLPQRFAENDSIGLVNPTFLVNGIEVPASEILNTKVTALGTTGTVSASMTSKIYTVTPTGAITLNASAGTFAGQTVLLVITTSGTTSFNVTPNTNFKSAVLATGTATAKTFKMEFEWDGSLWQEKSRTAAQ